jgi:hypothetical protein
MRWLLNSAHDRRAELHGDQHHTRSPTVRGTPYATLGVPRAKFGEVGGPRSTTGGTLERRRFSRRGRAGGTLSSSLFQRSLGRSRFVNPLILGAMIIERTDPKFKFKT